MLLSLCFLRGKVVSQVQKPPWHPAGCLQCFILRSLMDNWGDYICLSPSEKKRLWKHPGQNAKGACLVSPHFCCINLQWHGERGVMERKPELCLTGLGLGYGLKAGDEWNPWISYLMCMMETVSVSLHGNEHAMWNCVMCPTHNSLLENAGQGGRPGALGTGARCQHDALTKPAM